MKKQIIIGIIVVIAAALVAWFIINLNREDESVPGITGQVVCLPLRDPGEVNTLECALGLRNEAGIHMALQNAPTELREGETVTITGEIIPAEEDSKYATSGTIVVEEVR